MEKTGYKKGQAVMEYLITYGLALFVILIVLAILVAVVLPSLRAPETCQFTQPGFGCSQKQHVVVADESNQVSLIFQLDNEQGRPIIVNGTLCSGAPAANIEKGDVRPLPGPMTLNAGASEPFDLECYNEDGTRLSLTPGSSFKGSVGMLYNFQDEVAGAPQRLAIATVTGTVQSE